jgi:hypothetical protein
LDAITALRYFANTGFAADVPVEMIGPSAATPGRIKVNLKIASGLQEVAANNDQEREGESTTVRINPRAYLP